MSSQKRLNLIRSPFINVSLNSTFTEATQIEQNHPEIVWTFGHVLPMKVSSWNKFVFLKPVYIFKIFLPSLQNTKGLSVAEFIS